MVKLIQEYNIVVKLFQVGEGLEARHYKFSQAMNDGSWDVEKAVFTITDYGDAESGPMPERDLERWQLLVTGGGSLQPVDLEKLIVDIDIQCHEDDYRKKGDRR